MAAWVLIEPPGQLPIVNARERYLERVGRDGKPEITPHAICAKRFASAGVARRWASQHGELLADYVVARR